MDPRAQDVLLCDLCETDPLQYCCEHCDINLCTDCVSKHLSDSSKKHKIASYHLHKKFTPKYLKCLKHVEKDCEMYCESCHIPVCSTCISSGKHKGHDISDILEKLGSKKQRIQKDLEELEKKIYPRYTDISSAVQTEKAEVETNYGKLATTADQQGEVWHREVTAIVNKRKADIVEIKTKHLSLLDKHADEITHRMTEINQVILEMKNILDTNDISLTSTYKSRNNEFNKLPPTIKVTLPSLSTPAINTETLNEMFGSLTSLYVTTVKPLLDEPRVTATIDTGYKYLTNVSCLSEDQVWTRGENTMKLLNLQSKLLTSIQTKSGDTPTDIAVTRDGDLVYTDYHDNTINLIKNKQIQTVITLQGWRPLYVCCTAANGLLVTMISDDDKQYKVVRYSGSTEKQSIQFDDQGSPLYSSGGYIKYLSENKNLDICVADYGARAVVVVNQSGKLRFRYTGHPSNTKQSFNPYGITTDSQSHILTADCDNHRIHILDQDGQFLRYIHCHLRRPRGLCVDIRDNLFVAEFNTAKVKKIQYL
ncbi:E3 ubiquitin-protein ligase Midline-1-like [Ostrea edulis]|uniref:E3 ubiquitin-protein ligase Midline-1-like n=1 Tax=Ostrea edulis TaxID=37623 RepID=UPI0024AF967E|nr:E3 ubiquitin-protein ligase Midline-1-like [Ostrea edulis]